MITTANVTCKGDKELCWHVMWEGKRIGVVKKKRGSQYWRAYKTTYGTYYSGYDTPCGSFSKYEGGKARAIEAILNPG